MEHPPGEFDFDNHRQQALLSYLPEQSFYKDLALVISKILEEGIRRRAIKFHSIQHRAKEPDSFAEKASKPSETDTSRPRYEVPLAQITDLAGVRIITYFPGTLQEVDQVISSELEILEKSDKGGELEQTERFGYRSVHYLVKLKDTRTKLPEYERFADRLVEVQVRTILQHAWAEIEHDIQYKSSNAMPSSIKRRFVALAGLFEIADRELQAIQGEDVILTQTANAAVSSGHLEGAQITPSSLRLFMNARLGSDRRISDWHYNWLVSFVKKLGFSDLNQIKEALARFDIDALNAALWNNRQGQVVRFETAIMAALGEKYLERHPYRHHDWWNVPLQRQRLQIMRDAGFDVGFYDPLSDDLNGSES